MALENIYRVKVNTKRKMFGEVPEVVANDKVVFLMEVYEDAVNFDLLPEYSYKFVSNKLKGNPVIRDATLQDDMVRVELGSSEMAVPGKVEGTLQIFDQNNKRISTAQFNYSVRKDPSLQGELPTDDKTLVIANESLFLETIKKGDNLQKQLDALVVQGDSSPAANQARVDTKGVTKSSLKQRLDDDYNEVTSRLAQSVEQDYAFYKKGLTGVDTLNIPLEDTDSPIITFIDDDGRSEVYSRLYPIFQSKGEKFVSAVSPKLLNTSGYMTFAQAKELHTNGHEIINHNWNHGYHDVIGEAAWDAEIKQAKEWLYMNGYAHDIYVNPGAKGKDAIPIMRKYAKCAFNGTGQNDTVNLLTFNIKREGFGSFIAGYSNGVGETLDYYKAKVDTCLANKTWLVWMLHVWNQSTEQDVILGQLIDYIKSLGIKIVTASEGFRRRANRLEVGSKVLINRKGEDSFGGKISVETENARTNAALITDFPADKITVTPISKSFATGAGGFPFTYGGVLTTDRLANPNYPGYNRQHFEGYGVNEKWTRGWDTVNITWLAWQKIYPIDSSSFVAVKTKGSINNSTLGTFGTIPANSSVTKSTTIAGIGFGNLVIINPKVVMAEGLSVFAWVSATDTLSIRISNCTTAGIAWSGNFDYVII